jgi:putative redox protein
VIIMPTVVTTYDGDQHCTAGVAAKGKFVEMDCPYTGKGEELSPGNLLEAALAGCMLISMGTVAARRQIDLKDTKVEVELVGTPPPKIGYNAINVVVHMPAGLTASDRSMLERASDSCPIKHSFDPNIRIDVVFKYPR